MNHLVSDPSFVFSHKEAKNTKEKPMQGMFCGFVVALVNFVIFP
jgi:hypothetical protein